MQLEYLKFCMPNRWTFKMPSVIAFISKHIPPGSRVLIPFAGKHRFGDFKNCTFVYNDVNPKIPADHHLDAHLLKDVFSPSNFDVVIADPPFSEIQQTRKYGKKYHNPITKHRETFRILLKPNGIYIELGHASCGIKGFKKIALGVQPIGAHPDILILVQRKPNQAKLYD